jgi:hypothetical protein
MINDVMMGLMVYMSLFICFVLCCAGFDLVKGETWGWSGKVTRT